MRLVFANRASYILYNFLVSNHTDKQFLLPANICPCVPATFLKAKQSFRFVDIDVTTHAIDEEQCRRYFNDDHIGGLLYVQAYGNRTETSLFDEAKKNGWLVIEDCCLCEPIGTPNLYSSVDLQLFSTGYSKYIELPDGGGYGFVSDATKYEKYEIDYSEQDEAYQLKHVRACLNDSQKYNISPDCAWLTSRGLTGSKDDYIMEIERRRKEVLIHKQRINAIYDKWIPKELAMGASFNNWRYMLRVSNRELLLQRIFEAGFFAGTNYPSVSQMYGGDICPTAEEETKMLVNLFNDYRVTEEMAVAIAKIVRDFYEG